MSSTEGFNGVISPKITNSKIKSDFFLAFLDLILIRTSQLFFDSNQVIENWQENLYQKTG